MHAAIARRIVKSRGLRVFVGVVQNVAMTHLSQPGDDPSLSATVIDRKG